MMSRLTLSKHETREEHPLPAITMHWIHLVSMAVLIFTGFFIHFPFYAGSMVTNKTLHSLFAFILIATGVVRIYWAFFGSGSAPEGGRAKEPDFTFFFPEKENRRKIIPMLRYYLFLRRTHPRTSKYNPLQKTAYVSLIFFMSIQIITGFAMYTPTQPAFQPITYALGGPIGVRAIHYLVTWIFISITSIHIYLAATEAIYEIPLMFWWRESNVMLKWYGLSEESRKKD